MNYENSVELVGVYGTDETHALSAWTSTSRELTEKKRGRIGNLLSMLAKEGHHTPFEKSSLHFLVKSDIASHIHLLKHRIGVSINGECLTGDSEITFINVNGCSSPKLRHTIDYLHDKWENGRSHQRTKKDSDYSKRRIQEMRIRVLNEDTGFFEFSHIKDIWKKGMQDVYQISLKNGKKIKCTANHAIWTDEGYLTINNGLRVKMMVGCNGARINIPNRPWTFKEYFTDSASYTRMAFAKLKGMKYSTIKKWGYIFNAEFKVDENKGYKKGQASWNAGKAGTYKINIGDRKHNPKRGSESHLWRGGVTAERNLIGAWTTNSARSVHEKYNFTCQNCGASSGSLVAHHIIPVCQSPERAREIENLITVCAPCHRGIHKSIESEQSFASKVLSDSFVPFEYAKRLRPRQSRKLRVDYSEIDSILYLGKEMTYDIEVVGKNNNFVANGMVVHNSARYKEFTSDDYYVPSDWPVAQQCALRAHIESSYLRYHTCMKRLLDSGVSRKRAKESARFYLPYGIQLTCDVMFNWRSFAHFQKLRNDTHAQVEIRTIAAKMLSLVEADGSFPLTIKAMTEAGMLPVGTV